MNAGAYDHEEEVLLPDGISFNVDSITDICTGEGSLHGFDGANTKYNGLKVNITAMPKDGCQQVEISEKQSEFFGKKLNIQTENIDIENEVKMMKCTLDAIE